MQDMTEMARETTTTSDMAKSKKGKAARGIGEVDVTEDEAAADAARTPRLRSWRSWRRGGLRLCMVMCVGWVVSTSPGSGCVPSRFLNSFGFCASDGSSARCSESQLQT